MLGPGGVKGQHVPSVFLLPCWWLQAGVEVLLLLPSLFDGASSRPAQFSSYKYYPYLNITSNSRSELVQRAGESSVLSQNTELTLSTTGSVFKRELLQRVSITTELQRRQGR